MLSKGTGILKKDVAFVEPVVRAVMRMWASVQSRVCVRACVLHTMPSQTTKGSRSEPRATWRGNERKHYHRAQIVQRTHRSRLSVPFHAILLPSSPFPAFLAHKYVNMLACEDFGARGQTGLQVSMQVCRHDT